MSPKHRLLPYLALGVGILGLSFSALFVRWAAAPAPVMGFYRLGLSTIILFPFILKHYKAGHKLPWVLLLYPILGGVFTAFDHAFWNTSVRYTTVANAALFGNTAPLWVALVAWLVFRETLTGLFWAGVVLALSGAAIVLGSDFLSHPNLGKGDILAVVAGIFYAGYLLVTQRGREYFDTLSYTWLMGFISCLTLLGMSLALSLPLSGYPSRTYLAFLGAAVVSQIGGYFSVSYALGHLTASVVSPSMLGQPVVTAILALVFLGEGLSSSQWFGGMVVLTGIYLVHLGRGDRG